MVGWMEGALGNSGTFFFYYDFAHVLADMETEKPLRSYFRIYFF